MPLTPEEIKQGWFEAIKAYTNNFHCIEELENAPLPIRMAVEKMLVYAKRDSTLKQQQISDLSQTYFEIETLPQDILVLISPWCKVRW